MSVVVISGATASGKSGLAVDVALRLRELGRLAEIVNSDSMLVYRGMDIGTAKPTAEEMKGIPHHLVDVMDIHETASVAWFQENARAAIADIRGRGGVAVVVGGSALYVRAIVDHFEFPGHDAVVRERWEQELKRRGPEALHRILQERSPASAAQIGPGNGRRLVRALEVDEITGGHTPTLPEWTYFLDDVHQFGLTTDRAVLDARIEARVDAMWEAGLVDEVRRLMDEGLEDAVTASRAIGYHQTMAFLRGECTEEEARSVVKKATRRFFRRQLSWYRRDPRIEWLPVGGAGNVERVVASVS